jgi:hypothetical protein
LAGAPPPPYPGYASPSAPTLGSSSAEGWSSAGNVSAPWWCYSQGQFFNQYYNNQMRFDSVGDASFADQYSESVSPTITSTAHEVVPNSSEDSRDATSKPFVEVTAALDALYADLCEKLYIGSSLSDRLEALLGQEEEG